MSFKKIKHKAFRFIQQRFFPPLIKGLFRFVLKTSKVELLGIDQYYQLARNHPTIIMLWHNRIVLCPNFFGEYMDRSLNYTAYVSKSRDGEWLALTTESYPNGYTIRVPKFDKHQSLRQFVKTLKKSVVLITPDGPIGPIYKIKPGVIIAAQLSQAQIFPFSWSATKYWKLNTWDKMLIPKPFGKITIGFGEPFKVEKTGKHTLEEITIDAEEKLSAFQNFLELRSKN